MPILFIKLVLIIGLSCLSFPDSYLQLFEGNSDDCFRVGLTVRKTALTLYTKFYSSDIILASPLGIRMIIGGEGDKNRDYDFLSSLEMVIVDQMDVFLMQNWDHLMVRKCMGLRNYLE